MSPASRTPFVLLAVVFLAVAAGAVWMWQEQRERAPVVAGFEECVEAGHEVTESHPPRCRTPDGRVFEEDVDSPAADDGAATDPRVRVSSPRPNAVVSSPLTVRGEAGGQWYFEGDFPVRLADGDGNELSSAPARAEGEWMSEGFVPFEGTVTFRRPATGAGVLVLERSNPSGLASNAAQVVIPVRFDDSARRRMAVRVFFNRAGPDGGECEDVWPVGRATEPTEAGVRAALTELLEGPTRAERDRGFLSNIPRGVRVRSVGVQKGTAYADFSRTLHQAAGSCRVLAIRAQIEQTLLQLPAVRDVVISVDGDTSEVLQP